MDNTDNRALPTDRATTPDGAEPVVSGKAGIPSACRNCDGGNWVCENHADHPWDGTSNREDACGCGAGAPCPVCQPEMANAPLIFSIAQEARRYAAFYPPSSDGRNTFEMFAEFVETRAIAQAIEARRAATLGAVHESAVHAPISPSEDQTNEPG